MPCRWKSQGFSSGEDCVSKMSGKVDDPNAFCYGPAEALIHNDFLKIYKQFLNYEDGENRYALWVKALNLDETKPYGLSRREQFKWIKKHVDFEFWKEDRDAKYWRVEAGFPLESMNMNVYSNDELLRSARTIKGQPVNLNHSNVLRAVEILAGEYEDGVVECVLRVPHSARCVKGTKINDLIEQGNIVNVSLEASCAYTNSDVGGCGGMYFTGLALLTKETLPGIPLTRLMPLESIMVEALQSSTKIDRRKKKVTKLKMEAIEQDEETDEHGCVKGKQTWDAEAEQCVAIPPEEQAEPCPEGEKRNPETDECEPVSAEEQFPTVDITPVVPKPSTEPDEHGQCPEGKRLNALGKCVETEECGEGRHWDANANEGQGDCVADTPPKPEHPETSHGLPAAPQEDVLTMGPTEQPVAGEQPPVPHPPKLPPPPAAGEQPAVTGTPAEPETPMEPTAPGEIEPKPPHECQDDEHYDFDLNQCVPDSPITERVRRFKAEDKADSLKTKVAKWEKRYTELDTQHQRLFGTSIQQAKTLKKLEKYRDEAIRELRNKEVERDKWYKKYGVQLALATELTEQVEMWKTNQQRLTKKYNNALSTNLELSKKLTESHEDYLEIAQKFEKTKGQLNKAKSISKKITRLKT